MQREVKIIKEEHRLGFFHPPLNPKSNQKKFGVLIQFKLIVKSVHVKRTVNTSPPGCAPKYHSEESLVEFCAETDTLRVLIYCFPHGSVVLPANLLYRFCCVVT